MVLSDVHFWLAWSARTCCKRRFSKVEKEGSHSIFLSRIWLISLYFSSHFLHVLSNLSIFWIIQHQLKCCKVSLKLCRPLKQGCMRRIDSSLQKIKKYQIRSRPWDKPFRYPAHFGPKFSGKAWHKISKFLGICQTQAPKVESFPYSTPILAKTHYRWYRYIRLNWFAYNILSISRWKNRPLSKPQHLKAVGSICQFSFL